MKFCQLEDASAYLTLEWIKRKKQQKKNKYITENKKQQRLKNLHQKTLHKDWEG